VLAARKGREHGWHKLRRTGSVELAATFAPGTMALASARAAPDAQLSVLSSTRS
jgi:hypothetical protein